jgi:FkbM family methyltransferase
MKTIFDIGMYDGSDTAYYLDCGFRVVAVDANPDLVRLAQARFAAPIALGNVTVIHAAISATRGDVELHLSTSDPGSSSVFSERVIHKQPAGSVVVPGATIDDLFERFGVPHYLKIDIEGADRVCVLALTAERKPAFLSFEIGDDVLELLAHLERVGYRRFKLINQSSFRELQNVRCFYDRAAHLIMRWLGYRDHRMIRRTGRYFVKGHSSGPVPWKSDGPWFTVDATRTRLREAMSAHKLTGWYDLHAAVE